MRDFSRQNDSEHDGACAGSTDYLGEHLGEQLEDQPEDKLGDHVGEHTVYFQISNGGGRFACCVRLKSLTREDAMHYLSDKWPAIERMAQAELASRTQDAMPDERGICLVLS
jgi:hypothetical protein